VHIDGVARQGSDTQQRLRTSRSDLCRACPSQARREFAPTPSLILPILAAHHSLSSADFITNIAESSFRYTQGWRHLERCVRRDPALRRDSWPTGYKGRPTACRASAVQIRTVILWVMLATIYSNSTRSLFSSNRVSGGSTRILKIAIQGLAAEFRPVLPKMPNLDITDRATSRQPTAMSHVFSRRFLDYRAD
jgi:hypothetical protein